MSYFEAKKVKIKNKIQIFKKVKMFFIQIVENIKKKIAIQTTRPCLLYFQSVVLF